MKKFKKIKLLTSLSSIGLVAASVPVIATSCTTSPLLYGPNPNDTTIEISQIRWIKQKIYNYNTESEIIAKVKQDNKYIYSNYPGLEEATTVSATFNSSSNGIDITIEVTDFEQTKYVQSGDPVTWSATYVSPTPTYKTDISTLNWFMRESFSTNNLNTITNTIKSDNEGSNGAKISSWNNINVNVSVNDTYVSVNIVVNDSNTTYKGSVRWNAVCAVPYTISWKNGSGTLWQVRCYKMGNIATFSGLFQPNAAVAADTKWLTGFPRAINSIVFVSCTRSTSSTAFHAHLEWGEGNEEILIADCAFNAGESIEISGTYIFQ